MMKDSLFYLSARIVTAVLGLATVAVLTRTLSAVEYGDYALVFAAAGLFNALFFSWNSQAIFRHHHASDARDRLLTTGIAGFAIGLAVSASAGAGWLAVAGSGWRVGLVGIVLIAAFAWLELVSILLNVERRSRRYMMLQAARSLVNLLVGGAVAWASGSAGATILAIGAAWLLLAALPAFSGWARGVRLSRLDPGLMRRLFAYGAPLALSIALGQLLGSLDRFMLAAMSGRRAVGEYAVGYDLVQFGIGAVGSALSLSFYAPILRLLAEEGEAAARDALRRYSGWQVAILLPLATGFGMTSPGIARLLIGADLREGALAIMPWICATALIGTIKAFYADFAFQMGRWTIGGFITALVAVAINFALNLVMIPRMGASGAAQASLISFVLALVLALLLGRWRGFPLPAPGVDHLKALLATAAMAAALWPLRGAIGWPALIGQIALGAAVFALAAWAVDLLGIRMALRRFRPG